ncbi:hypothetical protein BHU72_08140 [Desulfuribacillus stibiiarsenatis]|uniref:PhiEco32-like amidoligase-type 2 protein n=1 Tax=Desulfuribacillus stibiiarsenatis TaxID=1390249 RepID=A0A1E5L3X5_9FIRM|nr:hypothetical protein [Desulfuribacillus stibiiarsenatis]OEH84794.1 hypothetical protein BHU72_08140 [Desulfuribacillus stibiiarsenatis]
MECKIVHSNQSFVKQLSKEINENIASQHVHNNKQYLIQWGKSEHNTNNPYLYTLNPTVGIENTNNRLRMFRILQLNNIDIPEIVKTGARPNGLSKYQINNIKTIRNYRIFVFQFQTLIIYRSNDNLVWLSANTQQPLTKYYQVLEDANRETKKVARLAEKAVFSLGLDFGEVWIGIDSDKKRVVLNVDSAPILNLKRKKLYYEAIVQFIVNYTNDLNGTLPVIGADAEFMLRRKGKMVLASKYFPKNGKIGCDARTINRDQKKRPLAEIRPDPSTKPDIVLDNIYEIFNDAIRKVNVSSIEWVAGSMPFKGYTVGGHIHFSDVKLNTPMVRALDNYLAIPFSLIEDAEIAKKRRKKYGTLGDVRTQFHGGFEYRTLSSWILCPKITKAALHLSYFIVQNYTQLRKDLFLTYNNQQKFYATDRNLLKKYFIQTWEELEKIPGFINIYKNIKILRDMIDKDEIWNELGDFKNNWTSKEVMATNREARSS